MAPLLLHLGSASSQFWTIRNRTDGRPEANFSHGCRVEERGQRLVPGGLSAWCGNEANAEPDALPQAAGRLPFAARGELKPAGSPGRKDDGEARLSVAFDCPNALAR